MEPQNECLKQCRGVILDSFRRKDKIYKISLVFDSLDEGNDVINKLKTWKSIRVAIVKQKAEPHRLQIFNVTENKTDSITIHHPTEVVDEFIALSKTSAFILTYIQLKGGQLTDDINMRRNWIEIERLEYADRSH